MPESERPKNSGTEPKVVEVVPILRGLPKPTLSYFYRGPIEEGEFVTIEVRGVPTVGIVSRISHARTLKTDLKSAGFALKKLTGNLTGLGLSRAFVKAAEQTAEFYLASSGKVLAALVPKLFLAEPELMTFRHETKTKQAPEPQVLQSEGAERFSTYQALIRENFARKSSVLFIAPTVEEARRAYAMLSQGIEAYTYLFLPQKRKTALESLNKACASKHPVLFISTPSGLLFDRKDLGTIVFEHESSRGYRSRKRPLISYRTFAIFLAKESGKQIILGDTVLSLETLDAHKRGAFAELSPLSWRLAQGAEAKLIDMKGGTTGEKNEFRIFSRELENLIKEAVSDGENIFLFGLRKGLAPTTVCGDCGTVLPCENCGAPVVLYEKKGTESRIYICHACGAKRSPETKCGHCGSWKLVPLGIGTERIAEEARKLAPGAPIFIFDKDSLGTAARARATANKIAESKGAIIVGTELYMLYGKKVPYSAIVTLDSLFAVPDFAIHERIFSLVSRIKEMTRRGLIIQTRNIGKKILEQAAGGNVLDFYRSEIAERTAFSYPPITLFIKVSLPGEERELAEAAVRLQQLFKTWKPDFIREKRAGNTTLSMILRLKRDAWPDSELREALSLLDPSFSITVDPESII